MRATFHPRPIASLRGALAGLALAIGLVACDGEGTEKLPALGAKLDATSVSGVSSGAYMAGQFQFAHSRLVVGAAIVAGGPYGCAESIFADVMPGPGTAFLNLGKAINGCMLDALKAFGIPNPQQLAAKARRLADQDRIDPIERVVASRVYLFSGKEDRTVVPAIVESAAQFYTLVGLSADQIKHVTQIPAGHAFVTDDSGLACDRSGKPYIVDCDYDQAGALLAHIYGRLEPRATSAAGAFHKFDQRPFTHDLVDDGLSTAGIVYVPWSCRSQAGCGVHIAFHGCGQSSESVGESFARESGFARWADTNRLIVLFPQVATTAVNPQGCWDWWGYTGREYLTRKAPQILAVRRMLDQLAGTRAALRH